MTLTGFHSYEEYWINQKVFFSYWPWLFIHHHEAVHWVCVALQIFVVNVFNVLSRLRWAGHVIRQDDDDLSRRVLLSEPGGKRPRGRPRLRWEDGVEEDVARLGCRNWKIVALNQEGWRKLLKEAEAHHGL